MLLISLALSMNWSFVSVFDPQLEMPFNNWSRAHVAQGFTWRPGSVSFSTLQGVGPLKVDVYATSEVLIGTDAARAILVPFTVPDEGEIEISASDRGEIVPIPAGRYGLLYETGLDEHGVQWVRLTFVSGWEGDAQVLRADLLLEPDEPLLMEAEPG